MRLTPEQRVAMKEFIARRVPQMWREEQARQMAPEAGPTKETLAIRAKGEWLIQLYEAEGRAAAPAILIELVADIYGLREGGS